MQQSIDKLKHSVSQTLSQRERNKIITVSPSGSTIIIFPEYGNQQHVEIRVRINQFTCIPGNVPILTTWSSMWQISGSSEGNWVVSIGLSLPILEKCIRSKELLYSTPSFPSFLLLQARDEGKNWQRVQVKKLGCYNNESNQSLFSRLSHLSLSRYYFYPVLSQCFLHR